jgi:hypothetical protein
MPAIINSAPDCINHHEGYNADDIADFVVGNNFQDCAGFMTFGPGSTYGPDGTGATTAYMVLTWVGIVFMVVALVGWMAYENHRLLTYAAKNALGMGRAPTDEPPSQPGLVE